MLIRNNKVTWYIYPKGYEPKGLVTLEKGSEVSVTQKPVFDEESQWKWLAVKQQDNIKMIPLETDIYSITLNRSAPSLQDMIETSKLICDCNKTWRKEEESFYFASINAINHLIRFAKKLHSGEIGKNRNLIEKKIKIAILSRNEINDDQDCLTIDSPKDYDLIIKSMYGYDENPNRLQLSDYAFKRICPENIMAMSKKEQEEESLKIIEKVLNTKNKLIEDISKIQAEIHETSRNLKKLHEEYFRLELLLDSKVTLKNISQIWSFSVETENTGNPNSETALIHLYTGNIIIPEGRDNLFRYLGDYIITLRIRADGEIDIPYIENKIFDKNKHPHVASKICWGSFEQPLYKAMARRDIQTVVSILEVFMIKLNPESMFGVNSITKYPLLKKEGEKLIIQERGSLPATRKLTEFGEADEA